MSLAEKRENLILHYPLNGMPESGNWIRPSRLPAGYQELEYIQQPSSAFIDTLIYATPTTKLEIDFKLDVITRQVRIFGSQSDISDYQCFVIYISDGLKYGFGIKDGSGQWSWSTIDPNIDRRVKIIIDNNTSKLSINDYNQFYMGNLPIITKNSLYTISLPGHSNGSQPAQCKIYNFKLFNNGSCVASMIPAQRISDNKIGMYDVVRNQFFSTANSVEFIAGPIVGITKPEINSLEYNIAGPGQDGTVSGTTKGDLLQKTAPKRYNGYYQFGNNCINCGREVLLENKDAVTVSWWGYLSNWNNYGRALSCTEGGGWNFEVGPGGVIQFAIYFGGAYRHATSAITWASLTSGWHHFVGTCDGYVSKLYLDNELIATGSPITTKGELTYPVQLMIAQESPTTSGGAFSGGYLSDIRIYNVALTANEIKELYDMGKVN